MPSRSDTEPLPLLLLDPTIAATQLHQLQAAFPSAAIRYATKCNPHPALLSALAAGGADFDTASPAEAHQALRAGATPDQLTCTNPVRDERALARSLAAGVRDLTIDSPGEVIKIAAATASAGIDPSTVRLAVRIAVPGAHAAHPLTGKFGCAVADLDAIAASAHVAGLRLATVSFHVGSQTREAHAWVPALHVAAAACVRLAALGQVVDTVNVGGGFPATYSTPTAPLSAFADTIQDTCAHLPALRHLKLAVEPGRFVAAPAGRHRVQVTAVVARAGRRWVHVNAGIYHGLSDVLILRGQEQVPITWDGDHSRGTAPAVLAGPTCDSLDVLDDRALLPADLSAGESLTLHDTGAYAATTTTTFNGIGAPTVLETRFDRL